LSTRHPFGRLGETLAMVRFSHTLFAMPFALMGMILAARGLPAPRAIFWIVVAMVGARTAAMTFNRIADRRIDAANPRTANRALPAGRLTPAYAWVIFALSVLLMVLAARRLKPLALWLSSLAVGILCAYSLSKLFTAWTHLFLGLALAGAPLGAWIAVRGSISREPLILAGAVLLWTSGFDVIYALQDVDFDRKAGLHSLPARLGPQPALRLAGFFHLLAVVLLVTLGRVAGLGPLYFAGVVLAAGLLVLEHAIVSPSDLSRMQLAFFRVNVAVGIELLLFTFFDLALS
jgi:4-hydroxybenzoate polyprenyltransferase